MRFILLATLALPMLLPAKELLGWALIEILVMWIMILLTLLSFHRVNPSVDGFFCPTWRGSALPPS